MKIPCTCIDDKNKPEIIPDSKWVVEGNKYHLTHIYEMVNQNSIKGCEIAEHDISAYVPYNCFRLDRFSFKLEDLPKLIQMLEDCTALNNIQISELIETLEIQEA